MPKEYAGTSMRIILYDLSGKRLGEVITKKRRINSAAEFHTGKGVYIARLQQF